MTTEYQCFTDDEEVCNIGIHSVFVLPLLYQYGKGREGKVNPFTYKRVLEVSKDKYRITGLESLHW